MTNLWSTCLWSQMTWNIYKRFIIINSWGHALLTITEIIQSKTSTTYACSRLATMINTASFNKKKNQSPAPSKKWPFQFSYALSAVSVSTEICQATSRQSVPPFTPVVWLLLWNDGPIRCPSLWVCFRLNWQHWIFIPQPFNPPPPPHPQLAGTTATLSILELYNS